MTSAELAGMITGYRWFLDKKIQIDQGEVYAAANIAQPLILADLRLIEDWGYLAFASGQARYRFTRGTIIGATNASPIVIEETGHPYHTGDYVTVNSVGGNTNANGRWPVTYVDANHYSLDLSSGNAAYTSGGYSYHCLMQACFVIDDIQLLPSNVIVKPKGWPWIQQNRAAMGAGNVRFFHQSYETGGVTLTFLGTPSSDNTDQAEFKFYRIPLPHEKISATVDPMIPEDARDILYWGTLYDLLEYFKNDGSPMITAKTEEVRRIFESKKGDMLIRRARQRHHADIDTTSMRL